ncbi:dTDP-4-dehydrorhamnose 3,5-epimerase [Aminobacter anthyllidis]|uniref:dTDP-4-dehydrorhamnose 3,5-epimerase n=1 Tax=Aminobacter anthyllidis TaxID=1035067 RepID=UPI00245505C9|nr:dTDP-4-dehydrorhamnose 3,5-epimerase [Aminobacter anthyllidis]MDH4984426.1 dTDP-4-dehydrorhamnose 3,5-epimerase [Aminobacter anthyllidis]
MVEVSNLGLDGVLEIRVPRFEDARGFFSETWNADKLAQAGVAVDFVQDNHSLSRERGVLRGLHFQLPPFAQDKLVRVLRGSIFDVAVDIRKGSPSFGKWVGLTLSAKEWNQILVPKGFAHGFVTLEPDTEVVYKVSAPYSQPHDRSIRFDDPAIAVAWPVPAAEVILSDKDAVAPLLADVETGFIYP